MAGMEDRRSIDSILREPLTRHRFLLNSTIRAAQTPENPKPFTIDDFRQFAESIPTRDPDFKNEVQNVIEALETGKAPQQPRFNSPETQLLWGAGLAYIKVNPDAMKAWDPAVESGELSGTGLWKQITGTRMAYQELLLHAQHVREALRDKNTKYAWGEPGSGFAFRRQKNIIDIDLMQTMIVGFEHARADVYREIGRALLTVTYPRRMQQVFNLMQPLLQKSRKAAAKKGPELKPEEYKKLRVLSAEWQLRSMMFDAGEENVTNRFVSNIGLQELQDYSISINNTAVTQRAIGLTRLPGDENASEELRRYMNLCNAVQLSFFQNNGLFDDTNAGWKRVGVDAGMVRKTATLAQRPAGAKEDPDGVDHADFKYLRELCGGPDGLENLQPRQHERLYGWNNMLGRVKAMDARRKEVIETIWDLYAEDLIQKILEQVNDQVDQQLKEAQDKQNQQGQNGESEDQDGEGEEQDGEGQQGPGQPGGKGKKGQKSKKNKQRGKQQGDPQDPDDLDDSADDGDSQNSGGKKSKKQNADKNKGDQQQNGDGEQDQNGEKQNDKGDGNPEGKLGTNDEDSVPVEGAGDMPNVEDPMENPGDEVDPDANGQDADGDGQDGDDLDSLEDQNDDGDGDAQSMDELEEKSKGQQGDDGDADGDADGNEADGDEGEDADGQGRGKKGRRSQKRNKNAKPSKGAGKGAGKSLADLAKQDWTNYPERIKELGGHINRVRLIFKKIQEMQMQTQITKSRSLEILPQDGEVKDRFNVEAHKDLTIKKAMGSVEEEDLKRFHRDENKHVPAEVDIVIMIDGSGSMMASGNTLKGVTPLQSALQAAAILYEAAAGKDMHMNVYVGMWGDDKAPILIKPGDDRVKVGQAMETMRKGLNSGTEFAPAVPKIAEAISEHRSKSGALSGFTHVLVLSDGDSADEIPSKEKIATMFRYSDKVTFDVAVITAQKGTAMEKMAKGLGAKKPHQQVGVVLGKDPNEVPMAIVGLLLEKVRKCGSFKAIPSSKKRRDMKKALNKMDPKK